MPAARPLIAYANRLPVRRVSGEWRTASGGLVTALRPALGTRGGTWVGWDGGARDLPSELDGLDLRPVSLTRAEVEAYYHGFANRTLWPLCHGLVETPVFDREWWRAYRRANDCFAAEAPGGEAVHWVHDYHLLLVPGLLREGGARGPIAFFLHVPFPPPELFARLPWRGSLLDGLLGADLVSFHVEAYRENFARACALLRDDVTVDGTTVVLPDGRRVETAANAISIDAGDFAERARGGDVARELRRLERQFRGRRVLVGVDRLDYTKGILERLRAFELLLEERPALRTQLALVQIAVPSRGDIREYQALRTEVETLVGRINGRFTEPGSDVPVHYLFRGVSPDRLLAYYRLADVALVTPLVDGMNLVAKEFVAAQAAAGGDGVLVLSEFTGAAEELRDALLCNPFDVESVTATICLALELEEDDRRERLRRMADAVQRHDVFRWAEVELDAAERAYVRRESSTTNGRSNGSSGSTRQDRSASSRNVPL